LGDAVMEPVEAHIDCFGVTLFDGGIDDAFCTHTGVVHLNGSGWLVADGPVQSIRVVRREQPSWPLINAAPVLASAADAMTFLMIWMTTWMGPLKGGSSWSRLLMRNMTPPTARDLDCGADR
jgi:hypothetical protein